MEKAFETLMSYAIAGIKGEAELIKEREKRERDNPKPTKFCELKIVKTVADLIEPAKSRLTHHQSRIKHYAAILDSAEKELREKGVSVEANDEVAKNYSTSFAIASGSISNSTSSMLQAKIDPKLMEAVRRAKAKIMEHQAKETMFDTYCRAFTIAPKTQQIELTIEEVVLFRLGEYDKSNLKSVK